MKMDDHTKDMWMSTKLNNNINIILIDSLESLDQREFGLQNSQQRVVLAFHCHGRLTNIKVRWKGRKWIQMDGTNPPSNSYMATHKQGNKETSNNQRPKKNKMKA